MAIRKKIDKLIIELQIYKLQKMNKELLIMEF